MYPRAGSWLASNEALQNLVDLITGQGIHEAFRFSEIQVVPQPLIVHLDTDTASIYSIFKGSSRNFHSPSSSCTISTEDIVRRRIAPSTITLIGNLIVK